SSYADVVFVDFSAVKTIAEVLPKQNDFVRSLLRTLRGRHRTPVIRLSCQGARKYTSVLVQSSIANLDSHSFEKCHGAVLFGTGRLPLFGAADPHLPVLDCQPGSTPPAEQDATLFHRVAILNGVVELFLTFWTV